MINFKSTIGYPLTIFILVIICFFGYFFTGYSMNHWSTGHYLISYKSNNDTVFYAVNGEDMYTKAFSNKYRLKDSIYLEGENIIETYHSEGDARKGWSDDDFVYDYLYHYCFYYKTNSDKFVILDDNGFNIDGNCEEHVYLEMQFEQAYYEE